MSLESGINRSDSALSASFQAGSIEFLSRQCFDRSEKTDKKNETRVNGDQPGIKALLECYLAPMEKIG